MLVNERIIGAFSSPGSFRLLAMPKKRKRKKGRKEGRKEGSTKKREKRKKDTFVLFARGEVESMARQRTLADGVKLN